MRNFLLVIIFLFLTAKLPIFSQNNENTGNNSTTQTMDSPSKKIHPLLRDKFAFNTGLYFPSKNIKILADGSTNNKEIEFDKVFGLKKKETTFAANFRWKFSKKWHLGVEYFGFKNNKSKTIDRELEWKDVIHPVGADITLDMKLNIYRVFFGRVLSRGTEHELGGGLGIHLVDIRTSLKGEVYIDEFNKKAEKNSINALAPLPNIGFWYIYAPTEKWALTARIDWFGIKIEEYAGILWNLAPGIKYQVFENIGASLNYRFFTTKFDIHQDRWHGGIKVNYRGPLVTVSANF